MLVTIKLEKVSSKILKGVSQELPDTQPRWREACLQGTCGHSVCRKHWIYNCIHWNPIKLFKELYQSGPKGPKYKMKASPFPLIFWGQRATLTNRSFLGEKERLLKGWIPQSKGRSQAPSRTAPGEKTSVLFGEQGRLDFRMAMDMTWSLCCSSSVPVSRCIL